MSKYSVDERSINGANGAFTIVELVVVIAVIGLLAALAVGAYDKVVNQAKVTKSLASVSALASARRKREHWRRRHAKASREV